jgi:DNA-binding transcriptional ArsR family regulator
VLELEVIEEPAAAAALLDPLKRRILSALATAGSAASLAGSVGLTRQKVNYHLRGLEERGLVQPVEQRQWGGLTERRVIASAASYVVSPVVLGTVAADPKRNGDSASASHLIALASRIVSEVGGLWKKARKNDQRLATLCIDSVVSFRSAAERAAFTHDLARAVSALVERYHDESSVGSRPHRLVVASYPAPKSSD